MHWGVYEARLAQLECRCPEAKTIVTSPYKVPGRAWARAGTCQRRDCGCGSGTEYRIPAAPFGSLLGRLLGFGPCCAHACFVLCFRCGWLDDEMLAGEATLLEVQAQFRPSSGVAWRRSPCLGSPKRKSQGPGGWGLRLQAAWLHAARPPPFGATPANEGASALDHGPCY
jgi:hypothetical protein